MKEIDWETLTFHYTETDYIVRCACHGGVWEKPYATQDKYIRIHAAATGLHYGQECFEGLKAFRGVDGKVRIFRMEENAKRMYQSAEGLLMTPVPTDLFCEAVLLALEKNIDFLPPYESGATLYFRPLLIATTPDISVGPGKDCEFVVIPTPIGPYFPNGFKGMPAIVNRTVDRAAPQGTGCWKVGGNYAASFRASEAAHAMGYECMFTDAKTHRYIDECTASNFIAIKQRSNLQGPARTTAKRSTGVADLQRSDLQALRADLQRSDLQGFARSTASIASDLTRGLCPHFATKICNSPQLGIAHVKK